MSFTVRAFLMLTLLVSVGTHSLSQRKLSSYLFVPPDTVATPETDSLVTGRVVAVATGPLPSRSTSLAMGLSAVVPGAGQIYVERYWTIPLIWGFGYYFGQQVLKADKEYRTYRDRYAVSLAADTSVQRTGNSFFLDARDFYRGQRDEFAFYLLLTYLLNIVDAYVGASLYGFDVSDDLGGTSAIRLSIPAESLGYGPRRR